VNRFGFTAVAISNPHEHWTARFVGHKPSDDDMITATYDRQDVRDAAMQEEVRRIRPGVLLVPFEITSGVRVGAGPVQQVKVSAEGVLPE